MQFQVPQFIETEDKIIGPLTLRQFLYLAGAGGISLMFFFSVTTTFWFMITLVVGGIAAAIAFIKVNGRKLEQVIVSAAQFYWGPQTYVWQPDHPELKKSPSSISRAAPGFSLESILSGRALKRAWQSIETGTPQKKKKRHKTERLSERFMVTRRPTGERRAAKRVDYR